MSVRLSVCVCVSQTINGCKRTGQKKLDQNKRAIACSVAGVAEDRIQEWSIPLHDSICARVRTRTPPVLRSRALFWPSERERARKRRVCACACVCVCVRVCACVCVCVRVCVCVESKMKTNEMRKQVEVGRGNHNQKKKKCAVTVGCVLLLLLDLKLSQKGKKQTVAAKQTTNPTGPKS